MSLILYNEITLNQNKISLNTGILLNGVALKSFLIFRLLNNPFVSSFLVDLDFLVLHTIYFYNIVPPFIGFETNRLMLFVFSPHITQ